MSSFRGIDDHFMDRATRQRCYSSGTDTQERWDTESTGRQRCYSWTTDMQERSERGSSFQGEIASLKPNIVLPVRSYASSLDNAHRALERDRPASLSMPVPCRTHPVLDVLIPTRSWPLDSSASTSPLKAPSYTSGVSADEVEHRLRNLEKVSDETTISLSRMGMILAQLQQGINIDLMSMPANVAYPTMLLGARDAQLQSFQEQGSVLLNEVLALRQKMETGTQNPTLLKEVTALRQNIENMEGSAILQEVGALRQDIEKIESTTGSTLLQEVKTLRNSMEKIESATQGSALLQEVTSLGQKMQRLETATQGSALLEEVTTLRQNIDITNKLMSEMRVSSVCTDLKEEMAQFSHELASKRPQRRRGSSFSDVASNWSLSNETPERGGKSSVRRDRMFSLDAESNPDQDTQEVLGEADRIKGSRIKRSMSASSIRAPNGTPLFAKTRPRAATETTMSGSESCSEQRTRGWSEGPVSPI